MPISLSQLKGGKMSKIQVERPNGATESCAASIEAKYLLKSYVSIPERKL
jgi:hypothetical protein